MIRTLSVVAIASLTLAGCGPKPDATDAKVEALRDDQAAAIAAIGALGGGKSHPQMEAFVANLSKVSDELVTVKDEASAKAMGQKLAPVFAEMERQSEAIEKLSEEDQAAAAMAAGPEIMKITMTMAEFAMKNPELMEIVEKELEKMPGLKD